MSEEYREQDEEREEEIKRLAAEKRRQWDSGEISDAPLPLARPSAWWYLVPLLFSLLGGVIMYVALRHEDKGMALRGLFLGLGITCFGVFLALWAILLF